MTAMFATYLHAFPGREKEALELGMEIAEFYGKLAADGKCTAPEQFMSPGTGKSYWFVKGERGVLHDVMDSDEGKRLFIKSSLLLEGFTVELVLADEEVEEMFTAYAGMLPTG